MTRRRIATTVAVPFAVAAVVAIGVGTASAASAKASHTATSSHASTTTGTQSATASEPRDSADVNASTAHEGATQETANDGPGGHADPTGGTVDHQFSGTE